MSGTAAATGLAKPPAAERPPSEDRIAKLMDAVAKLTQRVDALAAAAEKPAEAKAKPDDGDDDGKPRETAADDASEEDAKREAQHRADQVSHLHGRQAPPPMWGESLRAYRLRVLRQLQGFSPAYKSSDLHLIRDASALAAAESQIYSDARKAASDPATIGRGRLIERRRVDQTGRHICEFFGDVSATLAPFTMRPYRVTKFNTRQADY